MMMLVNKYLILYKINLLLILDWSFQSCQKVNPMTENFADYGADTHGFFLFSDICVMRGVVSILSFLPIHINYSQHDYTTRSFFSFQYTKTSKSYNQ